MSKLKVVIFTANFDTGGQGWRIKNAFDKYDLGVEVRSIHTSETYFNYPSDLRYREPEKIYELFADADVVHMRNGVEGLKRLLSRRSNNRPAPGVVVHYHGSRFREAHRELHAASAALGATELVSTIDLKLLEPGLIWLPSPHDLHGLANLRVLKGHPAVRVAHAPTDRAVKSTARVMEAADNLFRKGVPLLFDLIERTPWIEAMKRKAQADIYVDQLNLGYGNNAVEAWAMGIPVVAGVADPIVREEMIKAWGYLPFYEASEANLEERLGELATDPDLRHHWGEVGRQFVETYHDDHTVARSLAFIYRNIAA